MKKVAIMLALLLAFTGLTACGNSDLDQAKKEGKTIVTYWLYATEEEAPAIKSAVDYYNVNNTDNIFIDDQVKPSGDYVDTIERMDTGTKGPDVMLLQDRYIKRWTKKGILTSLQSYVDTSGLDFSDMWPTAVKRNRYNPTLNTNNETDDLYALPRNITPTGLYYNESLLEKHGIKVISVDEADLEAFNNGTKADQKGKTKAEYGIEIPVSNKGFIRDNPYFSKNGKNSWIKPVYGSNGKIAENIIFNNRISMSWDEIEDLGMIFTQAYNSNLTSADSKWGYYTEWWFNYGWGVGGDCAVDTTGKGDWTFTLGDKTKKALLYNEDGSLALDTYDNPIFVNSEDKATYDKEDGQYFGGDLPSQYEAFERFYLLGKPSQYGGLAIAPRQVGDIGTSTSATFFQNGDIAMLVEYNSTVSEFRKKIGDKFTWDVAPLPVYKEYNLNGTVKNKGIEIGHSGGNSMGIWRKSANKDAAYKVVEYMSTGKFQIDLAASGSIMPNSIKASADEYVSNSLSTGKAPKNISIFTKLANNQRPGDWWYMPDNEWIDIWATPLNTQYRENDASLNTFFETYTAATNTKLASYKSK